MFVVFTLLFVFCTAMMILGVIKPSLALLPFAKKGRGKAFLSWFLIGLACLIIAIVLSPKDGTNDVASKEIKKSPAIVESAIEETAIEEETVESDSVEIENIEQKIEIKDIYLFGEVAVLDNTLVQVFDVTKSDGSKYDEPKDGMEYVIVGIAIKNNGDSEINYNPYDFKMSNSKGQLTDMSFSMIDGKTALSSGELLPNGFIEGTVVFEQPVDDPTLTLVYTPSFWNDDNIKFDILNITEGFEKIEPGQVEITGTSYPVGEYAVLDGAKIRVKNIEKSMGSKYDKPKDDMEYIIITIEISNTGDSNLSYNPYYFNMINGQGQVVDQTFSMIDTDTALESGELLSGGIVEGTVVFEQLIEAAGLYLQYDDISWFSDESLLFEISE